MRRRAARNKTTDGSIPPVVPAVSTAVYEVFPCAVCGLGMQQTETIIFLEDCWHRFHDACIMQVFNDAPLTEYQGCPICKFVPRRMFKETRGPTHCRASVDVDIPMSKLSTLIYNVLDKENLIADKEDIPVCTRVLEKFYVFIATGIDACTASLLYEDLLKSKLGRLCRRMLEEIASEHPNDIRGIRMSEELSKRAKTSVDNCIMSIKADEYVRFKPQTDVNEATIRAFAEKMITDRDKGISRIMCNVYSIGIEDEPRAGPSKDMDRLFAQEPEAVEEVDPREVLLAKIKAKREARKKKS
ncbi:hypothetical protein PRIPAC_97867 [Pristionchus pacificus]|uniref:RING-type domain-containing protein n=1 Tax=Pristionchus pacificus TaxID=54126 RepID=A0A2A6B336_PRIPA|nr:hypothetical protein PRIPAC_97867 [Pristionchus pacificus]|eukprot:PDM60282.1 hypothetical protein PRIPAC_54107 [Pristionchus pacificus]